MDQHEFAAKDLTLGQLNAIVKKLGGHKGAISFLRGESAVVTKERSWREKNGMIYLTVTSDGTTGPQWMDRFAGRGMPSPVARQLLNSSEFAPTDGVIYEVAVLKGEMFKDGGGRTLWHVHAAAERRGLKMPSPELACLIRAAFNDREIERMGLTWIVAAHEPIKDDKGYGRLLTVDSRGVGHCLHAYNDSGGPWARQYGFAFIVPY